LASAACSFLLPVTATARRAPPLDSPWRHDMHSSNRCATNRGHRFFLMNPSRFGRFHGAGVGSGVVEIFLQAVGIYPRPAPRGCTWLSFRWRSFSQRVRRQPHGMAERLGPSFPMPCRTHPHVGFSLPPCHRKSNRKILPRSFKYLLSLEKRLSNGSGVIWHSLCL
jgi:hypothetical protein